MTVSSTTNRKEYAGNGVTTSFATSPVVFFASEDLTVYVVSSAGVVTTLTENTHYTVTGGGTPPATGTVNLAGGSSPYGAPATGATLAIVRDLDIVQETDFVQNDGSDADVSEAALDRAAIISQQLSAKITRSVRLADSDTSGADTTIPTPAGSSFFGWNAAGTALINYVVQTGTSLVSLAASAGASLIGFIQAGIGAVARTVQDKLRDQISVFDFMTAAQIADVRARTGLVNVATALQAAIDAAHVVGARLIFPAGIYFIGTTTLVFKNNVKYTGAGLDILATIGTVIQYTGTSDAIQINNPINSSTSAHIAIEDIWVQCTTRTAGKAAIADVGSTYLALKRVGTSGNAYGLILDQSELVVVEQCEFEIPASGTAGVWLVNGAEHTALASTYFTNRITIRECQFNGSVGVGIADDGGSVHAFRDNNFNVMAKHIRVNGVNALTISGNEMEFPTSTAIEFATTKLGGAAGAASSTVSMDANFIGSTAAIALVTLSASSVGELTVTNHRFDNANVSGTPFSGLTAGATKYVGFNNRQAGTGGSGLGNTINDHQVYTVAWASSGTQPAIGNGTLSGRYTRNGNRVGCEINFIAGSTTTFGTGDWTFSTPFANNGLKAVGSVQGLDSGSAYLAGVCTLANSASTVFCYKHGGGTPFNATEPQTWANADELYISVSFEVAKTG